MAVRPGTGMVVKFFKDGTKDSMHVIMDEVNNLTDKDLTDLVSGLTDGSLNY